jgi:hypothetical protein
MFNLLADCIFCSSSLPEERIGVGEHIFPESIFGFWRSYDVCSKCREVFGNEVNRLAIQDLSLLNAMETLKLKDTGPHLKNLPWTGEDTLDKRKISMVRRREGFRLKVVRSDDFMECSEEDLDKLIKPWFQALTLGTLSADEFQAECKLLIEEYRRLAPGETYRSQSIGYSIRRRQTVNIQIENPTPENFTRLIAKIVTCFLHYAVPYSQLANIQELDMLKAHAHRGESLAPFTINPLRPLEDGLFYPFHRIGIYPGRGVTMTDITFFRNIGWRTVLHTPESLHIVDSEGRMLEYLLFVLNFSNLQARNKHLGLKLSNQEDMEWYDVVG